MKKIYSWTLGGFFRALGRYFAYFLIFCLLALLSRKIGLPLFADIVFAETNQSYTSATYEVRQCKQRLNNGNYELYDCITDSANFNEGIQFGSENGHLKRIQYLLYNSNNYWNTGSYNIRLKIAIENKVFGELQEYRFVMYANESSSSSGAQGGSNTKYIANYTCNVENDDSTYDFYVNCTFNTKSPIKFIMIEMIKDYEAPGTVNTEWIWWMQVSSFTASTDSTDAINNQTDILNDAINNTNTTINNAINQQIESQKVCNIIDKNDIIELRKYLTNAGNIANAQGLWGITDYIKIYNSVITPLQSTISGNVHYCFYNVNKTLISCSNLSTMTNNEPLTLPNNAYYARFTISQELNKPQVQICTNGNQALNDTLTDSSSPDLSSLSNSAGWLPAGPVDSILNLPLTYLNTLSTALNGTCQEVQPTLPYINQQITLPCIKSLYIQMNVMSFVNWVGALVSGFILFKYFMNLYKWVDDTLTFRENNYIDNWGGVD